MNKYSKDNEGIYTLANDTVYDQLVALLNSIDQNIGLHVPICVIPYDNKLTKVIKEIESRPNVTLFDNLSVLEKWDKFIEEIWEHHPRAKEPKYKRPYWYKGFLHREFVAFEGDFEKFVFFDADSLAMKSIDDVFEKLDTYDLVFNDWEHTKRGEKTEVKVEKLAEMLNCSESEIYPKLHCDSFFASHKDLINDQVLDELRILLITDKGIECIRNRCWWISSALFNVISITQKYTYFNFTQSYDSQQRYGNCADSDFFINIDNVLYNEEGLKPIHRIHYMNYPSIGFSRLCQGELVDIRYADIFLHYRFLKNPEQKPKILKTPSLLIRIKRKFDDLIKKIKKLF